MSAEATHCWVVVLDIENFSSRPDPIQRSLRTGMYEVLREALVQGGLPADGIVMEDRGDGVLMIVPATVSPIVLAGSFVRALDDELRQKAAVYGPVHSMRFRVALHQGSPRETVRAGRGRRQHRLPAGRRGAVARGPGHGGVVADGLRRVRGDIPGGRPARAPFHRPGRVSADDVPDQTRRADRELGDGAWFSGPARSGRDGTGSSGQTGQTGRPDPGGQDAAPDSRAGTPAGPGGGDRRPEPESASIPSTVTCSRATRPSPSRRPVRSGHDHTDGERRLRGGPGSRYGAAGRGSG
ncbi:hypothetical protein NKH18_24085 [Streptomyces sp. M10(2022)]